MNIRRKISSTLKTGVALAALASCSGASAQVVINEVFENPPGLMAADARWEFIELYGRPGMDLTGYAVVLLKGGIDADRDGKLDPGSVPEIDEAFSLDGCTLDERGLFLLVNCDADGVSLVGDTALRSNPKYNRRRPDALENRRWLNGMSFQAAYIPSDQPCGLLDNEGSSTYLLVRARPEHAINGQKQSVYGAGYSFRKGVLPDINFDGVIDRGGEAPSPAVGERAVIAARLEPYQMVDEVAWSHRAGMEYVRSRSHVISDTPGLNPDAISRTAWAPQWFGHRTKDVRGDAGTVAGFSIVSTTMADESFVYGVLDSRVFPRTLAYFTGFDIDGWPQSKAPTDPKAMRFDGSCDPEPDHDPFPAPCIPSGGAFAFTDLNIVGLAITPGAMNDSTVPAGIHQFRFISGDFDGDGVVTAVDHSLIQSRVGASLDDRLPASGQRPEDAPYRWEGVEFQQILMMLNMDCADAGGVNAPSVTALDVAAHARLLTPPGASVGGVPSKSPAR